MKRLEIRPAWRFSDTAGQQIDTRLFGLLRALHATGKLTHAARQQGLSYRHAWTLLGKWSGFFGSPLVEMQRGRGAALTALGETLLWAEQRVSARLTPQLENLASELNLELGKVLADSRPVIRIHASHGFAVARLPELMHEAGNVRLDLQFRGSLDALQSLCRSNCELAGFHVPDGPLSAGLIARYAKWLRPRSQTLIHLVTRLQGLMLEQGNPKGIEALSDLTGEGVRFVNRQRGSGTRELLDQLLDDRHVPAAEIAGYENEEFTHAAVAAYVASGMADAGLGVEAAARQFGLDFIALASERYFLICRNDTLHQPAVTELHKLIQGERFQRLVDTLPGYDAARAGEIEPIKEAFPWVDGHHRGNR